jgi:solute carrier family 25 (mitochondrial carnitine/acylcarnitine transporter), member 20/29
MRINRQYGISRLYLGLNSTLLRESFIGVYFGTYDFLIRYFTENGKISRTGSFLSGGLAGVATWFVMYPVDYVKTRVQSDSLENPRYRNAIDCFKQEMKSKGLKNFYTGFSIMLARAFFVNAAGFVAF